MSKLHGDALALLQSQVTGSAAVAFFDPQHRGVLDKLAYGNEAPGRSNATRWRR